MAESDGRTWSWGLEGARSEWPADREEDARSWARHMSTDGRARTVHEYAPGPPSPGRRIATYLNGKEREAPGDDRKAPSRGRAARAAGNQRHVRDTLAAREPRTAAAVERAVRDLSPRARRSR